MKNIFNRPVAPGSLLYKVGVLLVLVLAVAVLAPAFSYLNIVFGWTNPTQNPPGGSGILTAYNGNIGINAPTPSTTLTVNGIISAVGHVISDVATPVLGKDAANRDFVLAQVGGGGGLIHTMFGTSANNQSAGNWFGPGGGVPACLLGYAGATSCGQNIVAPVPAGTGTQSCDSLDVPGVADWSELYAGYGPMNVLYSWYVDIQPQEINEATAPWETWTLSDSICSRSSYAYIRNIQTGQNLIQNTQAFTSACTLYNCNTCRVCIKY